MIDLHMHTIYSDGTENCISILKKCEEKRLDYISITDHNSVGAYFELENLDIKNYFSGTILSEENTASVKIKDKILKFDVRGFFQSNLFVFEKVIDLICTDFSGKNVMWY